MKSVHTAYHNQRLIQTERIFNDPSLLPHRYVFILTNRCNLKCSFCFQEKDYVEGSMTTKDWLNVIDVLPDSSHITLTGGEPFLFKGFKEVFLKATERHTCNIISNGLLLDNSIIDLLLSRQKFQVLSISVDNIGNTLRDVDPKKWEAAEAMFRSYISRRDAQGSHALLDTKTVVLDQNSWHLFEIYKYCVETLRSDTHSFMLLKGSPMQHADHMFAIEQMYVPSKAVTYSDFKEIVAQLEKVREYNVRTGKRCYTHPKFADLNGKESLLKFDFNFINEKDHRSENFKMCTAPWGSVHINVEGNVFPCMAIKMGNVKRQSMEDIFHGEGFETFKTAIKVSGTVHGCNRCGYLIPVDGIGQRLK